MVRAALVRHLLTTMKNKLPRFVVLLIASAITMILGTSCGTVRGVGQDVGTAGDTIEDATR